MGRNKRWWEVSSEQLVLLCFLARIVLGDGEVGCLFSKDVCRTGIETCFDDFAFGKCVRAFGEVDEEDTYRYDLDSSELELLRRELESLVLGGYLWTNPYTQCVIQSSLYDIRFGLEHTGAELCRTLKDVENSEIGQFDQNDADKLNENPQSLAVVNFTPIRGHGYGDYANEKYYPPASPRKPPKYEPSRDNDFSSDLNPEYGSPFAGQRLDPEKYEDEIDGSIADELIEKLNTDAKIDGKLNEMSSELNNLARRLKYEKPFYRSRREPRWNYDEPEKTMIQPQNVDESELLFEIANLQNDEDDDDNDIDDIIKNSKRQSGWSYSPMDYNAWNFLLANNGTSPNGDEIEKVDFLPNRDEKRANVFEDNIRDYENEDDKDGMENEDNEEAILRVEESLERLNNQRKGGFHAEGGFIQPIEFVDAPRQNSDISDVAYEETDVRDVNDGEDDNERDADDDEMNALLWSRNLAAFQRPERVDVKKPGPLYSTNNYAFKTQLSSAPNAVDDTKMEDGGEEDVRVLGSPHRMQKKTAKEIYNEKLNASTKLIYIEFNNEFTRWADGERVVEEAARLLNLDSNSFASVDVGRAEVTFKVANETLDPTDLVTKIQRISKDLGTITGTEIKSVGLVKNKVKLSPMFNEEDSMSRGLFGTIVAVAGAAATAAAVMTLLIARKQAKHRAKLVGLATPDPEASKDYQDLCRARMQAKQPNEKPESPRIISLSKENESNRSSTSSWGEEAAALTNMDIATGHMVLAYMEDHFNDKDRLDHEWAGICAYEADPSSVKTATDKSNADKNRPGSSLPYDHSRVVLNDLSNANHSDYINASTITDHDPRNPAYIATQGPLPQTSADFWQLVWEQGSVVIVMLTRLTEEGRGMCHRYWPEEGSESYHNYEVHLVSEHIWCDDYLVRSFYLKNLRTGETRTVTQFHFLSWPENGIPHSTKALLEFRRKVNKSYRGRSCPIVVHCSDGAGRTGTYCLIDMVLNRMAKGAKEIDIAAALEHIRDQRPGMVATKEQFEFVLIAIAGEVHAILKALPSQAISIPASESEKSKSPKTNGAQSSSGSDQ